MILLVLAALLLLTVQSAVAQQVGNEYFPETGHYVTGDFNTFYYANPDARLVYGLPVTEAFINPETGRLVQYFQNVRFEYFAENMAGDKIRLTKVGQELYEHGTYINGLTVSTPNCYQEAGWSYPVCFSFYTFYEEHGGERQFGRPVSGLEYLRGRLVQFFEYAQLVWHPEHPAEDQIVPAQLGLKYFYAHETNLKLLEPIRDDLIYYLNISEIRVSAFPKQAVISNGAAQVIDVIVLDQNNAPLANAIINVTLRYPDGTPVEIPPLATDKSGLASFAFTAIASKLGPVEALVKLTYNDIETVTVTSFRIWY